MTGRLAMGYRFSNTKVYMEDLIDTEAWELEKESLYASLPMLPGFWELFISDGNIRSLLLGRLDKKWVEEGTSSGFPEEKPF